MHSTSHAFQAIMRKMLQRKQDQRCAEDELALVDVALAWHEILHLWQ
jgi:hypothetical protein